MTEYKVSKGNILYGGAIYRAGSTVDLDDDTAQRLNKYLENADKKAAPKQEQEVDQAQEVEQEEQEEVNYEDYTISELKKIVEKENVEVVPTGKNGSAVKSDYIRALKQSN